MDAVVVVVVTLVLAERLTKQTQLFVRWYHSCLLVTVVDVAVVVDIDEVVTRAVQLEMIYLEERL